MNEQIREFLHILFKRGRFILIAFVLIAGPVITFAMLRPSQYRAAAKLILVGNRSYLQLSPQDSKRIVQVPDTQVVNAEVENLKNRSFLIAAAKKLEVEIISPVPADREIRARQTASAIRQGIEVTPF